MNARRNTSRIRSYTSADLDLVHAVYERAVEWVPHCWPITRKVMAQAMSLSALEKEDRRLASQAVFVIGDSVRAGGFIHVGAEDTNRWGEPRGVIRFFAYPRGQRAIGEALLDTGQTWLADHGLSRAVSFPQPWKYPHYAFPHAYVSDRLDHVQALLRLHGYEKSGGEVFLDWPHMSPPAPTPLDGPDVAWEMEESPDTGGLPNVRLRAVSSDGPIGTCDLVGGAAYHECARDIVFCDWLGVQDAWQGQGLGLQLLNRALRRTKDVGYRHAAISTAYDNDRAFLFYSNHGFHVVDWTYQFTRVLD